MNSILVLNAGSSSIKFSVFTDDASLTLLIEGEASSIGNPDAKLFFRGDSLDPKSSRESTSGDLSSFPQALKHIAETLDQTSIPKPVAIGHRVVHSSPRLTDHQRITPQVFEQLELSNPFAPLHQPLTLEIIRQMKNHFPHAENYACFDTIFHLNMPEVASTYPIPEHIRRQGVRRYGFHGLSCESILQQFRERRAPVHQGETGVPPRIVLAHLGAGASVTAILNGRSIDTTMGFTPCGGIPMSTRSGDLDPGLMFYLLRAHSRDCSNPVDTVEKMLNENSGLLAISGLSKDMRVLRAHADKGDPQSALAIETFVLGVKKTIGSYAALMGGIDALIFTGGIGENDSITRAQICSGLTPFGIALDSVENEKKQPKSRLLSQRGSTTAIYTLQSEEDRIIAVHVSQLCRKSEAR